MTQRQRDWTVGFVLGVLTLVALILLALFTIKVPLPV